MNKATLVLGGSGYIASRLSLNNKNQNFIFLSRTSSFDLSKLDQRISTVINLVASKPDANPYDSYNSNFSFPMSVYNKYRDQEIKWVQINSYYQLQPEVRKFRHYSIHKTLFAQFLTKQKNLSITNLYLPHVFGGMERTNRLIPTISRLNNGIKQRFGNANQYIPLLYIDDALRAILLSIDCEQKEATATPFWSGKLIDLLLNVVGKNVIEQLVYFDRLDPPTFKDPIDFPQPLREFSPQFQLQELKKQIEMRLI